MISMVSGELAMVVEQARRFLPVAVTLALLVFLLAALASTYFGHSRSPYDTCFGPNGRAVSCTILEKLR